MKRMVITVSRQYGSGGAEIARKLADLLGVEFFDKEKLKEHAENNGISKDVFDKKA